MTDDADVSQLDAAQKAKEELNTRIGDFIKEYGDLVAKHKIDFATYPVFVPENGAFKVIVQNTPVDITNQPVKSPFIPKE